MQTIEHENAKLTRAGYPPLADCEPLHTPGPWETDIRLAQALVVDSNGNAIADIARHEFSETEQSYSDECIAANARIISAAPDLLSALRSLVDLCDQHMPIENLNQLDCRKIGAARAAITKAEGRAE